MGEQTWMYRRKGEEVEGKVFDSEAIPEGEGWVDSPARVDEAEGGEEKPKRRRKAAATEEEGGDE